MVMAWGKAEYGAIGQCERSPAQWRPGTVMTQPATINLTAFPIGSWAFSAAHGESVRILDVETVWNHTAYQV
jgi:hypothetical protein